MCTTHYISGTYHTTTNTMKNRILYHIYTGVIRYHGNKTSAKYQEKQNPSPWYHSRSDGSSSSGNNNNNDRRKRIPSAFSPPHRKNIYKKGPDRWRLLGGRMETSQPHSSKPSIKHLFIVLNHQNHQKPSNTPVSYNTSERLAYNLFCIVVHGPKPPYNTCPSVICFLFFVFFSVKYVHDYNTWNKVVAVTKYRTTRYWYV
ncbi:unnamed protein product [Laminaria digitata]